MADKTLIKFKTGTIDKMSKGPTNKDGVPLEEGSVYFAIDNQNHVGQIVYDASDGNGGVERIVMSTWAEQSDKAKTLTSSTYLDGARYQGNNDVIHFGTYTTDGATAIKAINLQGFRLAVGSLVIVKYSNKNTATRPQLNVNNTGAKDIYVRGALIGANEIKAGDVQEYVYDGTNWNFIGNLFNDDLAITVDEDAKTLYITSPIENGDEVKY